MDENHTLSTDWTTRHRVSFGRSAHGAKHIEESDQAIDAACDASTSAVTPVDTACDGASQPIGRIPRVTRLMALAIQYETLLRDRVVHSQAELARLGYVSRARVTQIMNFRLLAPDIQEAILELPRTMAGRDPLRERHLRSIMTQLDWSRQRQMWFRLMKRLGLAPHRPD